MSWLTSSDSVARELAHLMVHGGEVAPEDFDVALIARSATLDLISIVQQDSRGYTVAGPSQLYPSVVDLDADLVRLFGQLLMRHPRPSIDTSPSEVLAHRPDGLAAQRWHDVARHALLARHAWDESTPASRPTGDGVWTLMHRSALLAEAITVLDTDLARTAAVAGRTDVATDLAQGAHRGLGGTAAAVRALAARGDLPAVDDVSPPPSLLVLPVRALADLPAATERLQHLISATPLTPADVQQIARAQAHAAMNAARRLNAVLPHPAPVEALEVAEALAEHAELLKDAASRPGRVAGLLPNSRRPLLQATEIARCLADHRAGAATPGRTATELIAYAAGTGTITKALRTTAVGEIVKGRWLVPPGETSTSDLTWTQPTATTPAPPLLRMLGAAADHAPHLGQAAFRAQTAAAPSAAAVARQGLQGTGALSAALASRQREQPRPTTPGLAAGPRTPTRAADRSRRHSGR